MNRRYYHHKIVNIYCKHFLEKTEIKGLEWYDDEFIDFKLIYYALKNVCALTDYKMNQFKINNNSVTIL